MENIKFLSLGERSILLEFNQKIDRDLLLRFLFYKNLIFKKYSKEILYINHAFNSIIITYITTIENINSKFSELEELFSAEISVAESDFYEWRIPVCYHEKFGTDLAEIAMKKKLGIPEIIELHSSKSYTVFFLGFLPGFLYLHGLDQKLHVDRKVQPSLQINKGDVGIGGSQTGIYPSVSPGGWNIIGNSPIDFFDPNIPDPCFARPGDQIRFYPISMEEYKKIQTQVEFGNFELEKTLIQND